MYIVYIVYTADIWLAYSLYRADWEPAAPRGKCMAGVPGVFWRYPAVLWGPSTHNPAWVAGENPYFEKLADFPYVHVEMG